MISNQQASINTSKYRQIQSDINRVISDMEDFIENVDHVIYAGASPTSIVDILYYAKEQLEEVIYNICAEEDSDLFDNIPLED